MKYITLVLLLLTVTACQKESFNNNAREYRRHHAECEHNYQADYTENAVITMTNGYPDIRYGNKTVFSFTRSYTSPSINFQADSGVTSFTYIDKQLAEHNTYYYIPNGCFGGPDNAGAYILNNGTITGTRVSENDAWLINIDIELPFVDEDIHSYLVKENSYYFKSPYGPSRP